MPPSEMSRAERIRDLRSKFGEQRVQIRFASRSRRRAAEVASPQSIAEGVGCVGIFG